MTKNNEMKIGLGRKIALGAGDFGFNLYWQMASLYLLFFYTDVVGLPPAIAGTIYMAALIWDALLDPVIGVVADRTRSRFGRYRPYLLFGGIPLALCYAVMFATPSGSDALTVTLAAALHVGFRTIYAVVSIPYAAMFARITQDARVRADLAAFRMVFATTAAIVVAASTLPLVHALATPESPRRGWILLGCAFGIVATLMLLLAAWAAKGFDRGELEPAPKLTLNDSIRSLRRNNALLIIVGAVMLSGICGTLFGKNLLYYFKYVLGKEELGSAALALLAVVAALSVPLFAWIARRFGKRNAWLSGSVPGLAGLILWHVADGGSLPLLFTALALCACGSGSYAVSFWSMLPDTVEYGEWRSGIRTESMVFGLAILGQKVSLGIGAGFLGIALTQVGYVANAVQTPETLEGIKQMMFWIPLVGGLCSAALIALYPVGLADHARMVEELAARKAALVKG